MHKKRYIIEPLDNPNRLTSLEIFAQFANQPWSLLLDSAGDRPQDNRFDILLWAPATVIQTTENETTVLDIATGQVRTESGDPIAIIQHLHEQFIHSVIQVENPGEISLPFIAGLAGAFGYDLGRHFETLPNPFDSDTQCPQMAVGLYTRSLIYDHSAQCFYDCRSSDDTPFSLQLSTAESPSTFSLLSEWRPNTEKTDYIQKLEKIHDYLEAGDCYQVNFAQRFSAVYSGDPWVAYQQLRNANKAPFSAYFKLPQHAVLSISPERFLSVKQQHVETKPIKGTRPRSAEPKHDKALAASLLSSEKDRAENLMIVDLLRNDISKHCKPHSVRVPTPFALESYEAVHHMVSTVVGELNDDTSPLTLLKDAFPGGSITGAPKIRAMQIIDELELAPRDIYCGSIGYLGLFNDMDTSICIRTLLADNERIHCWAGGGIVLDSEPQDEYQECLDKVNKILPILA